MFVSTQGSPAGVTDADGDYTIEYNDKQNGAFPGATTVVIKQMSAADFSSDPDADDEDDDADFDRQEAAAASNANRPRFFIAKSPSCANELRERKRLHYKMQALTFAIANPRFSGQLSCPVRRVCQTQNSIAPGAI